MLTVSKKMMVQAADWRLQDCDQTPIASVHCFSGNDLMRVNSDIYASLKPTNSPCRRKRQREGNQVFRNNKARPVIHSRVTVGQAFAKRRTA